VAKVLQILVLVLAPLGWGLFVDFVFERLRRRRAAARSGKERAAE
jgi:hypothetical protein